MTLLEGTTMTCQFTCLACGPQVSCCVTKIILVLKFHLIISERGETDGLVFFRWWLKFPLSFPFYLATGHCPWRSFNWHSLFGSLCNITLNWEFCCLPLWGLELIISSAVSRPGVQANRFHLMKEEASAWAFAFFLYRLLKVWNESELCWKRSDLITLAEWKTTHIWLERIMEQNLTEVMGFWLWMHTTFISLTSLK